MTTNFVKWNVALSTPMFNRKHECTRMLKCELEFWRRYNAIFFDVSKEFKFIYVPSLIPSGKKLFLASARFLILTKKKKK